MLKNKISTLATAVCLSAWLVAPVNSVAQPVGLPSMGATSNAELSPVVEKILGDAIMEQGRHDPTYIADLAVNQYLTDLGDRLAVNAPKPIGQEITVFAVRDASINAFAMPGGYIGINSGLVYTADSEAELASVLAHEIGHVMQRHIARGLAQQSQTKNIMIASIVGAVLAAMAGQPELAMGVATFGQAAGIDQQLGFSRSAEQEADRSGLQMMARAGFDPNGMADMFKNLMRVSNLNEGVRNAYASTHPLSLQRLSDIENRVQSLQSASYSANPQFWFIRAELSVIQSRDNRARQQLEESLVSDLTKHQGVRLAAAYYGLALLAYNSDELKKSADYLSAAGKIHPALQLDLLTIKISTKSDPRQAVELAKNAYGKWPQSVALAYEYGKVLQLSGDYANSTKVLESATKKWPAVPDLQKLLATSYQQQGNKLAANETMAMFYEQTGALPTAVEHLQQAREQSGDFYAKSRLDTRIREIRDRLERQREVLEPFKNG